MLANFLLVKLSLYQSFHCEQVEELWELLGQLVELVVGVFSWLELLFIRIILGPGLGKTIQEGQIV